MKKKKILKKIQRIFLKMEEESLEKPDLFICDCHNTEHQFIIMYDKEYNLTYIHINLVMYNNIFKRVYYAFKYIFGHKSRYGAFDEFILNKDDAQRLIKHLEKIK